MKTMWKYILSFSFLLALSTEAICQEQTISIDLPPDTLRNFSPDALRIGVSVSDALKSIFYEELTREYSFEADLAIDRFLLVADYGHAEYERSIDQAEATVLKRPYQYNTQGSYFKIGIDVNFLKNKSMGSQKAYNNTATFGLRYAQSNLTSDVNFEDYIFKTTNPNPEDGYYTFNQQNIAQTAWWLEMVAGMKIKIVSNVFFGYTVQFRFLKNVRGDESLIPYDIPGFGSHGEDKTGFGFDYYIFYRIPFKKKVNRYGYE